jgi:hypothetical protein
MQARGDYPASTANIAREPLSASSGREVDARLERQARGSRLFSSQIVELAHAIIDAQSRYLELADENRDLYARLDDLNGKLREQEIAMQGARRREEDLRAEWVSLRDDRDLARKEASQAASDSLARLFTAMASDAHNRLLQRLLSCEAPDSELLSGVIRFLRDVCQLTLIGDLDQQIVLNQANWDDYESLGRLLGDGPWHTRIVGRGISWRGRRIVSPEVELIEQDQGDGN